MELNPQLLKNIRRIDPYVPGEQPREQVIKLNTNENPYPPAPGVQKILEQMSSGLLRLYPDPTAQVLVEALAKYHGVDESQIFAGVGSDDVIAMCFMTFFDSGAPILFPDISYSFYKVWAELFRIPYERPPLDDNFNISSADYYRPNGGVIFPNPNAPTGVYEELSLVEDILQHNRDVIVIVDEAYIDFAGKSALELVNQYDNLIVVQTFSKSRSMAGIRIGYAISNPVLIGYLNDVKYSFNSYTMNLPSLLCGAEAVKDNEYFEKMIKQIIETREWTKKELRALGFEFPDARANFIFATHPQYDAKKIFEALKRENIYVRHWDSDRIEQYLRITVGTQEEMQTLIAFLKRYLEQGEAKR